MPRKDGFPTNNEMMVDFEQAGRNLLVAAYEREHQHRLEPPFDDKPLTHLRLSVWQQNPAPAPVANPAVRERAFLAIEYPNSNYTGHLQWSKKQGEVERRHDIIHQASTMLLTDSFEASAILPEMVVSEYSIVFKNGSRRVLSNLDEKPVKQSLISASFFFEGIRSYIHSDEFDRPVGDQFIEVLKGGHENAPDPNFHHVWSLHIDEDLPLNGREPQLFLERYHSEMNDRIFHARRRISNLRDADLSDDVPVVARQLEILKKTEACASRAFELLLRSS